MANIQELTMSFSSTLAVFFGLYAFGYWLLRHGINGLTAEPHDRYYALRGWTQLSATTPTEAE
jgi:hypothetical protein